MKLGLFVKDNDGAFSGRAFLLGMPPLPLRLKPAKSDTGIEYYRALTRDGTAEIEIGAAFSNVSKGGKPYIKVILDNPALAAPLIGYLHQDKFTNLYDLVWKRPIDEVAYSKPTVVTAIPTAEFSTLIHS